MRESALGLAPAKAGRQVSWAGENREVLSLAFGLTVPVQRKLPVSVLTVLPKGRLCVTCEMSHLRRCDDEGLPLEHVSFHGDRGGTMEVIPLDKPEHPFERKKMLVKCCGMTYIISLNHSPTDISVVRTIDTSQSWFVAFDPALLSSVCSITPDYHSVYTAQIQFWCVTDESQLASPEGILCVYGGNLRKQANYRTDPTALREATVL